MDAGASVPATFVLVSSSGISHTRDIGIIPYNSRRRCGQFIVIIHAGGNDDFTSCTSAQPNCWPFVVAPDMIWACSCGVAYGTLHRTLAWAGIEMRIVLQLTVTSANALIV